MMCCYLNVHFQGQSVKWSYRILSVSLCDCFVYIVANLHFRLSLSPWICMVNFVAVINVFDVCVTVNHQYNNVSNQQDTTTFSFINLFLNFLNQPYMFRATNSPILWSTFWLYIQLLVKCTDTAAVTPSSGSALCAPWWWCDCTEKFHLIGGTGRQQC